MPATPQLSDTQSVPCRGFGAFVTHTILANPRPNQPRPNPQRAGKDANRRCS